MTLDARLSVAHRLWLELDLQAEPLLSLPTPKNPRALWHLVHLITFRYWLMQNLGVQLPSAHAERLAAIDTTQYTSAKLATWDSAVAAFRQQQTLLTTTLTSPLQADLSARPAWVKLQHRDLNDWLYFMGTHEAHHWGMLTALTKS